MTSAELRSSVSELKERIYGRIKDLVRNYTEDNPLQCDVSYGDWCAEGTSSLYLPSITAVYYEPEWDGVRAVGDSDLCTLYLDEFCIEDLLEILEGLELYVQPKNNSKK